MHSEVIVATYGSTYALPNKDPEANRIAIEGGDLDLYLMITNGEVTGTSCLVNTGDGKAELGRSASIGRTGNSIIQDLRILDWLINPEASTKYHTLFTTLRSAPDRTIDDLNGNFVMRGGQAVTEHSNTSDCKSDGIRLRGFESLSLHHKTIKTSSHRTSNS